MPSLKFVEEFFDGTPVPYLQILQSLANSFVRIVERRNVEFALIGVRFAHVRKHSPRPS